MTVALTDVLIELSDPQNLARFNEDKKGYLQGKALSPNEIDCLLTGDRTSLQLHARSVETADKSQQFNRWTDDDLVIEIEAIVEVHLPNEQVAVAGPGMLFVDENGRLFRAVSK